MEPEALGYCTSGLRLVKRFSFLVRVFRWKDRVTRAHLNSALLTHLLCKPNLSSTLLISDESPAQHSSAVRMLTMRTMDWCQCIQSSEQSGSFLECSSYLWPLWCLPDGQAVPSLTALHRGWFAAQAVEIPGVDVGAVLQLINTGDLPVLHTLLTSGRAGTPVASHPPGKEPEDKCQQTVGIKHYASFKTSEEWAAPPGFVSVLMVLCCRHPELTGPLWELKCVQQECQHASEYSLLTPCQAKPQTLHHSL